MLTHLNQGKSIAELEEHIKEQKGLIDVQMQDVTTQMVNNASLSERVQYSESIIFLGAPVARR